MPYIFTIHPLPAGFLYLLIINKSTIMKKIEAIIRKTKFEEVKTALHEVGIDFMTYWDARGVGTDHQGRIYRGVMYDTSVIERTMISFVVRDINVDKSIKALLKAAYTGEVGDGRIFISTVDQSLRIRTGDEGDESLYDKESGK
jgi:nitrogen regulatory protein P-II 1